MPQTDLFSADAETRELRLLKHVNAVALMPTKGGGRITASERRLFNVLLYWAQDEGERGEYSARLHEILKLAEYNSNNTAELKKALKNLMRTVVEWQSPTSGEIENWEACVLLSGASIKKDKNTGAVTLHWRYDSKIQSQLLAPDRYARLLLQASIQLRTHPAMTLYEICARYVDNPGHKTAKQHWRWWRPVLGGVAYEENSGEYRYWKRDTLIPAIAEINANTELEVTGPIEYKERDNKTISLIQFEVRLKARARRNLESIERLPLQRVEAPDLPLIGKALELGVAQQDAELLYVQHGRESLTRGINELAKRLAMPKDVVGAVERPGSWLKTMMKNRETEPQAHLASPSQPSIRQGRELERSKAALKEEWLRRKKDELRALFQELPKDEQSVLLRNFRNTLTLGPLVKRFDTAGWDHRMVRDTFANFLGETWEGPSWTEPKGDDILSLALEGAAAA